MSELDSEMQMLRNETRNFVENEVIPEANVRDTKNERMSDKLIGQLGDMGYFGLMIPEEYGGLGMGPLAYSLVVEELCRGWMSVGTLIARGQYIPGATDDQKEEYLPKMATGEKFKAVSISESGAGSDVAGLSTKAEKAGDEYIIDGQKMWCTGAKLSDFICVYARTGDENRGHQGVSGFLVDKSRGEFDVDGLSGQKLDTIGFKGWNTWELNFDGVRVPESKLIGEEEGKGFYQIMNFFEPARIHVASRGIGLARAALEDSLAYAQEREQFGESIGNFQAIRFKLATMATKIEAARQLTHDVARKKQTPDGRLDLEARCDKEAAMAKYFASEMAEEVTSEGIQIHGGNGYTTDYPLERYWRDARLLKIVDGTSEIQQRIIADRIFEKGVN